MAGSEASSADIEAARLRAAGLTADEIDLIARRRRAAGRSTARPGADGLATAVVLAAIAGTAVHAVRLGGDAAGLDDGSLLRIASLLLVPGPVALLALRRGATRRRWLGLLAALVAVALVAVAVPHRPGSDAELLAALHLPILAWTVVLAAHADGRVRDLPARIAAVRFSGEVAVLYVLFALGGGALVALTAGLLGAVGLDAEPLAEWVLPAGAAGAVVIAAWLVETRPHVGAGVAPLLAQVFTPLLAVTVFGVAAVYAVGSGGRFDRDVVALLDVLLVLVVGLAVYGQAARDTDRAVRWDDRLRLGTVAVAVVLDLGVLAATAGRLFDLGVTPNRIAAVGLNAVLLVVLTGTAVRLTAAVRGRQPMASVEHWQAASLPLIVVWAAVVAVLLPLLPIAR